MHTTLHSLALLGLSVVLVSDAAAQALEPSPAHKKLQELVGVWDAEVGTMTYTMEVGGLWLIGKFKGQFDDVPFEGHSMDGYDTSRKKYVGVWVDSISPAPMLLEGEMNEEGNKLTMQGKAPGPDGKLATFTGITEMQGANKMTYTMKGPSLEGENTTILVLTYTRRNGDTGAAKNGKTPDDAPKKKHRATTN